MRIFGTSIGLTGPRWNATRFAARLGVVAATVAGVALAFHVGGRDGYTLPLSGLLGMPTNVLLLRLIPHFQLASSGSASEWSFNHLAFCATIAINWTLVGVAIDLLRWRRRPQGSPSGLNAVEEPLTLGTDHDALLAQFEALERAVKTREPRSRHTTTRRAA